MEEIIENLANSKRYYLEDIDRLQRDIQRDNEYIASLQDKRAEAEERLRKARAFVDQYDEAIAILSERGNQ